MFRPLSEAFNRTENGGLKLQIYRKPTNTDQYLNFSSHHPIEQKQTEGGHHWDSSKIHCSMEKWLIAVRKQNGNAIQGIFR